MKSAVVAAVLALTIAPLAASVSHAAGIDFSNSEPRDAQSEKIACPGSMLKPPANLDVDCGRYPLSNPSCHKQGYVVESKAGQPATFVFAMTRARSKQSCGIAAPQSVRSDMVMAIKKYRPFVRDDATNWSKTPIEL